MTFNLNNILTISDFLFMTYYNLYCISSRCAFHLIHFWSNMLVIKNYGYKLDPIFEVFKKKTNSRPFRIRIPGESQVKLFSDYYYESIILLKYEFCWEWSDVVYFVTNQRANPKVCYPPYDMVHILCTI